MGKPRLTLEQQIENKRELKQKIEHELTELEKLHTQKTAEEVMGLLKTSGLTLDELKKIIKLHRDDKQEDGKLEKI
ncbi:hypothetical protein AGMMS49975_09180 [Clostridia bacterium]|nr:hypothetical protein AGMMS49975_09180 [Clostridia bacterium]